jgi:hypothetical protein
LCPQEQQTSKPGGISWAHQKIGGGKQTEFSAGREEQKDEDTLPGGLGAFIYLFMVFFVVHLFIGAYIVWVISPSWCF